MFFTKDVPIIIITELEITVIEVFWKNKALYESHISKQAFVLNYYEIYLLLQISCHASKLALMTIVGGISLFLRLR